jgi:hypothetical protein
MFRDFAWCFKKLATNGKIAMAGAGAPRQKMGHLIFIKTTLFITVDYEWILSFLFLFYQISLLSHSHKFREMHALVTMTTDK